MAKSLVRHRNWSPLTNYAQCTHPASSHGIFPSARFFSPTTPAWKRHRVHGQIYEYSNGVTPKRGKVSVAHSILSRQFCQKHHERQRRTIQSSISVASLALVGIFFAVLVATDTEKPQKFKYPSLDPTTDGIRLLILQPGKRGSTIKCGLVSTTFGDNPTYDALSYEWGHSSQRRMIWLNGLQVLVRENLWEALDSLRDTEVPKPLWVDFLCIDQNNKSEKNTQIPLMAFIYRRARKVVIWLGSHRQPIDILHEQKLGYAKRVDTQAKYAAEIKLEYSLYTLLQEGYWKRAWIIQEVGMASKIMVHHGSGVMEWEHFIKLLNWYKAQNPKDAAAESIIKLDNMGRSKFLQTDSFSFRNLVDDFRDAFCELPHDKVYAFIGLANDTIDNDIPINYEKKEPEVYQDVMRHHFQSLRSEMLETSSIEAVYFAALIRRLLTRYLGTEFI